MTQTKLRIAAIPRSLHYTFDLVLGNWTFKKREHGNFDLYACPPWRLDVDKPIHGIFPEPPEIDTLKHWVGCCTTLLHTIMLLAMFSGRTCHVIQKTDAFAVAIART